MTLIVFGTLVRLSKQNEKRCKSCLCVPMITLRCFYALENDSYVYLGTPVANLYIYFLYIICKKVAINVFFR